MSAMSLNSPFVADYVVSQENPEGEDNLDLKIDGLMMLCKYSILSICQDVLLHIITFFETHMGGLPFVHHHSYLARSQYIPVNGENLFGTSYLPVQMPF